MRSPITGKEMKLVTEPSTISLKNGSLVEYDSLYYKCEDSGEGFTSTALDTVNYARMHGEDCNYAVVTEVLEGPTRITNGYNIKVKAVDLSGKEFIYVFVKNIDSDYQQIRIDYDFVMNCNPKFL